MLFYIVVYSFYFLAGVGPEIKCTVHVALPKPKIQQTKMLVTCQRFGDLFLFGLVWQYSSIQKNIVKVGSKS